MNPNMLLREATVQDIQLELIRRTQRNDLDGEKVCELLEKHRHLWVAAILDRISRQMGEKEEHLPFNSLIKLRDLAGNWWNCDNLFVLTRTPAEAKEMAALFEAAEMGDDVYVHEDERANGWALGYFPARCGLMSVWWD